MVASTKFISLILIVIYYHNVLEAQSSTLYALNSGGGQLSILSDQIIIWSLGENMVGTYETSQPTYIFGFQTMMDEFISTSYRQDGGKLNLSIYPQPATQHLNLLWEQSDVKDLTILITNGNGSIVNRIPQQTYPSGQHQRSIDVDQLTPGPYVLLFLNEHGNWLSADRFIKM